MIRVLVLVLVLCGVQAASAVTHSLYYYCTGTSGKTDLPAVTVVTKLDDEVLIYYNDTNRAVFRQEWMNKVPYLKTNNDWLINSHKSADNLNLFRSTCTTEGNLTFQHMCGCEQDSDSRETRKVWALGFNGSDLLRLDTGNWTWIRNQTLCTQLKFNKRKEKTFLEQYCIQWLEKFVNYKNKFKERNVEFLPDVAVLHRPFPSGTGNVTCLATGFFPGDVAVSWRRDGQVLTEGVDPAVVLPNGDGSFQVRRSLRVSEEELKRHNFTCFVNHSSLRQPIVKSAERKNEAVSSTGFSKKNLLWLMVIVLVVILGIIWWYCKKRMTDAKEPLAERESLKRSTQGKAPEIDRTRERRLRKIQEPKSEGGFPIGIIVGVVVGVVVGVLVLIAVVGIVIWTTTQTEVKKPLRDPAPEVRVLLGDPAPDAEAEAGLWLPNQLSLALRQAVLLQHPTRGETFQM